MMFTVEDVYKELRSLKPTTSAGVSKVSNKMLKEGAYQLAWPLSNLFNYSMDYSEIPSSAISIKVVPIPKQATDKAHPSDRLECAAMLSRCRKAYS